MKNISNESYYLNKIAYLLTKTDDYSVYKIKEQYGNGKCDLVVMLK